MDGLIFSYYCSWIGFPAKWTKSVLFCVITQRNSLKTFRENLSIPSSRVKKSKKKILENEPGRLSRNVGNELPLYAA